MTLKEVALMTVANGLQLAVVYGATIGGSVGIGRIAVFGSVVSLLVGLIAVAMVKPSLQEAYARGGKNDKDFKQYAGMTKPIKKFLSRATDLISVAVLVYYGFWVSAICLFLSFVFFEAFVQTVNEFVEEKRLSNA